MNWKIQTNYLFGITAGDWWKLLQENRFQIDPAYLPRAAGITVASLVNSCLKKREERLYASAIANTQITQPPLFILGHWRSGTSHLHRLLVQDTQFAYPNSYQVAQPHTFLCTEALARRRLAGLVPDKRPMDNMALSFDSPGEEEFALSLITRRSPDLGFLSFPRHEERYLRYLSFCGVPEAEIEQWKSGFVWFLKKLTLKYARPLVLKSPPHTARIRLLLEMFPDARFVHIHRDPYTVFQSFRRLIDTTGPGRYLHHTHIEQIEEWILRRYVAMYDSFFEQRDLIPAGQFHEMGMEELEHDAIGQMRGLYEALNLTGFEGVAPLLQGYLASISGYVKNTHQDLDPLLRQRIARAWGRNFREWGYALPSALNYCESPERRSVARVSDESFISAA